MPFGNSRLSLKKFSVQMRGRPLHQKKYCFPGKMLQVVAYLSHRVILYNPTAYSDRELFQSFKLWKSKASDNGSASLKFDRYLSGESKKIQRAGAALEKISAHRANKTGGAP